jgi:hypothetical protein
MIAKVGYTVAYVRKPEISVTVSDVDKRIRLASDAIGIIRGKVIEVIAHQGFGDADDSWTYILDNGDRVHDDEAVVCGFGEDTKVIINMLKFFDQYGRGFDIREGVMMDRVKPLLGAFEYEYANGDRLNAMPVAVAQARP